MESNIECNICEIFQQKKQEKEKEVLRDALRESIEEIGVENLKVTDVMQLMQSDELKDCVDELMLSELWRGGRGGSHEVSKPAARRPRQIRTVKAHNATNGEDTTERRTRKTLTEEQVDTLRESVKDAIVKNPAGIKMGAIIDDLVSRKLGFEFTNLHCRAIIQQLEANKEIKHVGERGATKYHSVQ